MYAESFFTYLEIQRTLHSISYLTILSLHMMNQKEVSTFDRDLVLAKEAGVIKINTITSE